MLHALQYRGVSLTQTTTGVLHDEFVQTADNQLYRLGLEKAGGGEIGIGQSWDPGSNVSAITDIVIRLIGLSVPAAGVGMVRAHIYAHSGTFGTSSVPTGDPLVSSQWFAADTLSTTALNCAFAVSGWTPTANTDYVAVLEADCPLSGISASIRAVVESGAQATHAGNAAIRAETGGWSQTTTDLAFKIYSVSGSGGASSSKAGANIGSGLRGPFGL